MSKSSRYYLEKKAKQGFRGYPVATIVFYGPTADFASKVAVAVFATEGGEPEVLERFFSQGTDVRFDDGVGDRVLAVIQSHGVQSVVITDGIFGCPHEEGIDYPEGTSCPQCPFWAGRDRGTLERNNAAVRQEVHFAAGKSSVNGVQPYICYHGRFPVPGTPG